MTDRMKIDKFPTPLGEVYRVGNTFYLYTRKPVVYPVGHVKRALGLPASPELHNQTASLRTWVQENNIPSPKDSKELYNYVLTLDKEEAPTVWPSQKYMRAHRTFLPATLESYTPRVVYPMGTNYMCRFGHPKPKNGSRNCHRCAWWRNQGVDLSSYTPTHCIKGHALKNNRWLILRHGRLSETCVRCNNERIINETGYMPHD
jgi:hypothetical protein